MTFLLGLTGLISLWMTDDIIDSVLQLFTVISKRLETSFTVKLSARETDGFLMGLGKRADRISCRISLVSFDLLANSNRRPAVA